MRVCVRVLLFSRCGAVCVLHPLNREQRGEGRQAQHCRLRATPLHRSSAQSTTSERGRSAHAAPLFTPTHKLSNTAPQEKKKAKKADKKMKKKEKKEKKRRRKDSSSGSSSDSEEEERPAKKEKKDSSPAKKEAPVSEAPFVKKAGYGLQSKGGAPAPPSSGRLGPDPELLRAKSETEEAAKRKTAELLARKRGSESSAPTERAARLREMQEDAGRVDRERAKKVSDKAKENDDEEEEVGGSKASFLADMARNTHGVGDQEQSLGDRISRNKQNSQRGDANMF